MLINQRTSLLDQDLYQLLMAQVIFKSTFKNFAKMPVEYTFICRNAEQINFWHYVPQNFLDELNTYLTNVCLNKEEYEWLEGLGYFGNDFLDWLLTFRFNPEKHLIVEAGPYRQWSLKIRGTWLETIFYEIFCLSFFTKKFGYNYCLTNRIYPFIEGFNRLNRKIGLLKEYNKTVEVGPQIAEFGTRRRFNFSCQNGILDKLLEEVPNNICGTSNVLLAKSKGIQPIGTHSHSFIMAMQSVVPIQESQKYAWEIWWSHYRKVFGIVLSDTFCDFKFFRDFSLEMAHKFTGIRADSGDPFVFGESVIGMYENYGIDPLTKKLVFSDGLDIPKVIELHKRFYNRINLVFGAGTNLTNDIGFPVPSVVIKLTKCRGQDVCKISNEPSKACCANPLYLEYVKMAIEKY